MDAASSELYNEKTDMYHFPGESRLKGQEVIRSTEEMIAYFEKLVDNFPRRPLPQRPCGEIQQAVKD